MEGIHKYLCHTIPALLIVTGLVNAQSLERRPGLNENFVSFTEEKYEFPAPPCHEGNLSQPLGRVEAFVADSFADDVLHRYSIEGSMNYDINRITGEITAAVANPAPAAAQQAEEFLVRVHILYFATYNPTETAHISALRNRSGRVVVSVATHKVLAEQTAVVVMTCDNFQSSRPTAQLRVWRIYQAWKLKVSLLLRR